MKTKLFACALVLVGLPFASLRAQEPRLSNLSTLGQAGTGDNILTAGFVIGPGADKRILVRAVGPTLGAAPFRITGALADPQLTLVSSTGTVVATNDNWISSDASTFSSVGAFALPANSRDSAIVTTLASGSYTAQVTGANNGTGIALVEVYEVGNTGAKLVNLSTRLQVSSTFSPIIGFVVSPGASSRRFLARTAGPALAAFGVSGTLADPTMTLNRTTGTTTAVASNNDWGTPANSSAATGATLTAAFSQFGAFAFPSNSRDAAMLVEVAAGNYGIQVGGGSGASGVAIVEVYDTTQATPPVVTVTATKATADESGNNNAEFLFTRTGDTLTPLTISYGVGGSAVNSFDYANLPGTITFPAGESTVKLPLLPNPDLQNEGTDTVVVTVIGTANYTAGSAASATATIADNPATLYIASVRPTTTATGGTAASGTATILLSASGTVAAVNVTFSNLSSTQNTAYLTIGANEDFVLRLPVGQVIGNQWFFTPIANYTSAQLLDALKSGNISIRIDTAKYPTGEVKGTFIQAAGARVFSPPPAPPAVSLTNVTANDAARLLTQATFGPTKAEIDALTGGSLATWVDAQLALPFTSHRAATLEDRNTFGGSSSVTNWQAIHPPNRQNAWWKTVLTAPDQLRQRVAFALSQILVISDVSLGGDNQTEPLAHYYDMLGNGAFGNYRTLLENVTLHPMMGNYLSSLRNSKADPVTGQTPDENYAREVMQLFSIGLNMLQPDGTLQLGNDGLPIATYNQNTITEMAKVFTGWSYFGTTSFRSGGTNLAGFTNPMILFPANHDTGTKDLNPVLVTPIPANQGGVVDLRLALDALFAHPNTAPFISKQLIQRLVTSNPSPAYVYRVAKVWEDQKSSPTQLASVVRAILTDYEARSPDVAATQSFGKLKEPILRLSGLLRSFGASSISGRFSGYRHMVGSEYVTPATANPGTQSLVLTAGAPTRLDGVQGSLAQAALRSPTVFNFYHPDYVLPGTLARAGLVVPEFEITDDNYAISVPNFFRTFVIATLPNTTARDYAITLNTSAEQALVSNVPALLDRLNLVLCAGNMPAATRTRITTALTSLAATTSAVDRVNTAILLTLTSPAAAVQK
ncbi:MAG: DUF1800 family protein [Verrucomicrobia bacterium]|nr:DUF1800 family protein [Verrucomicrobiota bacterium]